nr:nucleotide-binding alpha-beta plait domain-containing protein [Tanacetum cinerariifolium]
MGNYRTKEDDVASISTSVYVTNFPKSILAKDLFKACRKYGHMVDSFIPNKKSKTGKRFGFIKFINVFSEERLINNLCTVWIDCFKLHANIARFQRPMGKKEENGGKKPFVVPVHSDQAKKNDRQGTVKSYRGALNGDNNKETMGSKEIAGLMLMTMEPEIQRNLEPLHAHEMLKELKTLFAQQAEQELLQTTRDFHSCKQEERQSVSSYVLKMKGYIDNLERLEHLVTLGLGYLVKLMKKKKNTASGAGGS